MMKQKMTPGQYKFYKLCLDKHFFLRNQTILLALSGGQDSMTLFNWLYDLREKLGIKLAVAHINHKVRPASDQEEVYLRAKMMDLGIPFHFAEFSGVFSEEAARKFRYDFFKKVIEDHSYDLLVTAHHKGDQAETVFMRLVTGRRLRHLTGIVQRQAFSEVELLRPLLSFDKSELDAPFFFEDQTNHENQHLRNRVRNLYLPELKVENPQLAESLVSLADESRLAMSVIDAQIEGLNLISERVDLENFRAQSEALQYFILQKYLAQFHDLKINKRSFDDLLKIIKRPQQYQAAISQQYTFVKDSKNFYLLANSNVRPIKIEIFEENPNDPRCLEINLPVNANYDLRARQAGDFIQIHHQRKRLKKFFIDQKIDLGKRELPVIAVGSEIYGIPAISATSDLSFDLQSDRIKKTIWTRVRLGGEA